MVLKVTEKPLAKATAESAISRRMFGITPASVSIVDTVSAVNSPYGGGQELSRRRMDEFKVATEKPKRDLASSRAKGRGAIKSANRILGKSDSACNGIVDLFVSLL
jgi:hypothetical protein